MAIRKMWSIAFLMLFLLNACDDDDYTLGVWKERSDLDGPARSCATSFTIGNKGYLCLGYNGGTKYYTDLWMYNIDGDYWTELAKFPGDARHDAVGFAVNGKGYISCGYYKTSETYFNDCWQYDPDTDSWTQMDDFPGTPRYGAIAFSLGNYGYVGMGKDEDNELKDIYRFDPSAASGSQWQIVTGYGGKKRLYASVFVINNEAYICLGINANKYLDDFWKFDGTTWTELRKTSDDNDDEDYDDDYGNICRQRAVTFVIDGKGYIVTGTNGSYLTDYWVYYPEKDLWYGDSDDEYTPFTHDASSRDAACSFSTGTRGFVLTGRSGSTTVFDDVWELLPYEYEDAD